MCRVRELPIHLSNQKIIIMANDYRVELTIKGKKSDLDTIETIFFRNSQMKQTFDAWYLIPRAIEDMGFNPDTVDDIRAYTKSVIRDDDHTLTLVYVGAWNAQYGVLRCIKKRWSEVTMQWWGADEFGQEPRTNIPELVGKYQLEDAESGLCPFDSLDDLWVGEEAVPVINEYYHKSVKTLDEAFASIPVLCHSMQMQLVKDEDIFTDEEMSRIEYRKR